MGVTVEDSIDPQAFGHKFNSTVEVGRWGWFAYELPKKCHPVAIQTIPKYTNHYSQIKCNPYYGVFYLCLRHTIYNTCTNTHMKKSE